MRKILVLAALALSFGGGASAAETSMSGLEPLPSEAPAVRLLQQIDPKSSASDKMGKLNEALQLAPKPTPFRGMLLCMRGQLTWHEQGQTDGARKDFEDCNEMRPGDPVAMGMFSGFLLNEGELARGAQLFIRVAHLAPDLVEPLKLENVEAIMRQLDYAGERDLSQRVALTLGEIGWHQDQPRDFGRVAIAAIGKNLSLGDVGPAAVTLQKLNAPEAGLYLLIDRRFEAIWPVVETWAGGDLSAQRAAQLGANRAEYEESLSPSDRFDYVRSLDEAGQLTDAIAEIEKWLAEPPEEDPYYRNRAVSVLADLLTRTGRREEGIGRLRSALTGPAAKDESAANIVPNLAAQLILDQDYRSALDILDKYTPEADGVEASAALGYFVALRACSLAGLKQNGAADAALRELKASHATNHEALDMAVSCLSTPEGIAALWIDRAESEADRSNALLAMERAKANVKRGRPTESIGELGLRKIIDRDDVSRVFEKYGRSLPVTYESALLHVEE